MNRVYPNRIDWENEPSTNTPINETNLNKIDYAVYEIDGRVVNYDLTKANQSDLLQTIKTLTYNTTTGVFVFEFWNGGTYTVDLNIEKIPVSFSMSESGVITMVTADGTTYTCDISTLIKLYTFVDSNEIDFTTTTDASGNKNISASIKTGSITGDKLQPNFLADCIAAKNAAQLAANNAQQSEDDASASALVSEGWANGKQNGVPVTEGSPYYHNNAEYWKDQANPTRLASLTDVDFSTLKDDEIIVYDATSQKWKNEVGVSAESKNATISSSAAKFDTRTGGILQTCEIELDPIQDLHGYDNPWVGGSGKNKLQNVNTTRTANGITYTVQDDGSFIANRVEASSNLSYFTITNSSNTLDNTQTTPFKSGMTIYATSGVAGRVLRCRYANGNYADLTDNTAITLTDDIAVVYVEFASSQSPSNFHFYPMIRVEGDSTWQPYSNICPITGHSSVAVDNHGFNIWDEQWENGSIDSSGNNGNNGVTTYLRSKNLIPCEPSTNYYLKAVSENTKVVFYDSNGNFIQRNDITSNATFTSISTARYMKFWVYKSIADYYKTYDHNICLNVSSANNGNYEPYIGNARYTIQIGQTVYGGTLDAVSGKFTITEKYIKANTLTWTKHTGSWNNNFYYSNIVNDAYNASAETEVVNGLVCSHVGVSSWDALFNTSTTGIALSTNGRIAIGSPSIGSLDDFNALAPNIDICYPLATPTTIQLTPQQIETLVSQNNITVPLDGQSITSLTYRDNMSWDDVEKAIEPKADKTIIGTEEKGTTASKAYAVGEHFIKGGKFCTAKTAIASGATLTLNTNYVEGDIATELKGTGNVGLSATGYTQTSYEFVANNLYMKNGRVVMYLLVKTLTPSTSNFIDIGILPNNIDKPLADLLNTSMSFDGGYNGGQPFQWALNASTGKMSVRGGVANCRYPVMLSY